jgi:hypothetical protein
MMKFRYFQTAFILAIILSVNIIVSMPGRAEDAQPERRLLKDMPGDTGGKIYYAGSFLDRMQYDEKKKAECAALHEKLQEVYFMDFKVRSTKYFNIAYRCPEKKIKELEEYCVKFYEQVYARYFIYEPPGAFQIVYFENREKFENMTGSNAYGFYLYKAKALITYADSGHGTLWHEMIHAFADVNQNAKPQQWFSEGFASFYEMAFLIDGKVVEGYANWRLPQLQDAVKNKSYIPLKTFLSEMIMNEDFGYAEARYFFCYLWINNAMEPFVKAYMYELSGAKKPDALAKASIETIESIMGKNINDIEKEYLSFVRSLKKNQKLTHKVRVHVRI